MSDNSNEKLLGPWGIYGKNVGKALPMLALFLTSCLLALGLSLLSNFTLFLTIPFLVMPMFFVLEMSFIAITDGVDEVNWGDGLFLFPVYFRPPFLGSYRVIRNFLFSLLIYFGVTFFVSLLYVGLAANLNPEFQAAVNEITQMMMDGNVEAMANFTLQNEALRLYSFVTSTVAFGAAVLFFSIKLGFNAFLLNFSYSFFGIAVNLPQGFFLRAYRESRGHFGAKLFQGTFWLYILGAIGYAAGAYFAYYLGNIALAPTLGLSGFAILTIPFLPYCFAYGRLLSNEMNPLLLKQLVNEARRAMDLYRKQALASEEELSEMEKGIQALSESIKKVEEENKKENPTDPPSQE